MLSTVTKPAAALTKGGPLSFVHANKLINWEWQGLVEALSIQIPERYNVELLDALPGDPRNWWRVWQLPDAFSESIRWRDKNAFTDRTLELFNWLPGTHLDQLSILIELSASVDHPWNADFLHRNLLKRKLIRRDQTWTNEVSNSRASDDTAIGRSLIGVSLGSAHLFTAVHSVFAR